jgi:hypothetical protein
VSGPANQGETWREETCKPGGRWCKVLLLALTIISAAAGVICALEALGVLPHRRTKSHTVMIVVGPLVVEPRPDRIIEQEPAEP